MCGLYPYLICGYGPHTERNQSRMAHTRLDMHARERHQERLQCCMRFSSWNKKNSMLISLPFVLFRSNLDRSMWESIFPPFASPLSSLKLLLLLLFFISTTFAGNYSFNINFITKSIVWLFFPPLSISPPFRDRSLGSWPIPLGGLR